MYNERNIHKELEASSTIGDTSICSEKPTGNDLKSTKRFVENQQESNRSAAPSNSSMNSTISTSTSTLSSVSSSSTNDSKTTKKESSLFNKCKWLQHQTVSIIIFFVIVAGSSVIILLRI